MENENTQSKKNKDWALIAVIVIFILVLFAVSFYKNSSEKSEVDIVNQAESEQERKDRELSQVNELIVGFGVSLKNVSLLADQESLSNSMDENYTEFLTPDLLEAWKENPDIALGRKTSSPWPEMIEIVQITNAPDGAYIVEGRVIEITSAEKTGTENEETEEEGADQVLNYDVEFRVVKTPDGFRIAKVN